jgi:two-component system, OmpR family, heavy metal sensor histidine kinase CusS
MAALLRFMRTFRFRVAAWNAAVVIFTAAIVMLVLRQGVRWAILHEMDQILIEDLDEVSLAIAALQDAPLDTLSDDLRRKAVGHQHHGWFVQLMNARGEVVWQSTAAKGELPPARSPAPEAPFTEADFRIASRRLPQVIQEIAAVRVGASLRLLRADLRRIDQSVLLTAGVVLLLAPTTGYWLALRALRPVDRMIRTAAGLRPGHLEERLQVRGTQDELDRLAQTVNALLDRIAVYLKQKRDFLANAAHELRTPLAAIRSSIDVTLASERTAQEYEELLVDVIDQNAALETLVNQLLLISESESEALKNEFVPTSLSEIVNFAVDMFAGVAESRGIDLEVQIAPALQVRGNRHLLRQLANNLIDNALKYTPPHQRVEVAVESDGANVRFRVQDWGTGIASEDVPHIFERFYRGDKSRTRIGETVGTGLGLSICQAVVEAHGGQIRCDSQLGKGTRITVLLPALSPSSLRSLDQKSS